MNDFAILSELPAADPYRQVLDNGYEPAGVSEEVYQGRIRPMLLVLLEADASSRPATTSTRLSRRGRLVPYLVWCHTNGYAIQITTVLDPDLRETYLASRPAAAKGRNGVEVLRSALRGFAVAMGTPGPPASLVRRDGGRASADVPLSAASSLLRTCSTLRDHQQRERARAVLGLAHGAGAEAYEIPAVRDEHVTVHEQRGVEVQLGRGDRTRIVSVAAPYDRVLQCLASNGRLTGSLSASHAVARTVRQINDALGRSGVDLVIDINALRAGRSSG